VPSHSLSLTLYRKWRDGAAATATGNHVGLLFELLDHASWRSDVRPWRHLAHHLANSASEHATGTSPTSTVGDDMDFVRHAWSVRKDWWPSYHFDPASVPDSPSEDAASLIGYKASTACLLLSADHNYVQVALVVADRLVVKTKGTSQLKKVVLKNLTLPLDS